MHKMWKTDPSVMVVFGAILLCFPGVMSRNNLPGELESVEKQMGRLENEIWKMKSQISELKSGLVEVPQLRTTLDHHISANWKAVRGMEGRLGQIEMAQWEQEELIRIAFDQTRNLNSVIKSVQNQTSYTIGGEGAIRRVNTTDELRTALENAVSGSVIELAEGVYSGPFVLRQDGVTVRGQGEGSIIQLETGGTVYDLVVALDIFGNNCEIQNLKMVSESEHTIGVNITGSGNTFTNVSMTQYNRGFVVYGNQNILRNTMVQDTRRGLSPYSVAFMGNNNSVNALHCGNCTYGIYVRGNYNSLQQVRMRNTINPSKYSAVYIASGSGNLVNFFRGEEDEVKLMSVSRSAVVRDVVCGRVNVDGTRHTLVYVDAGRRMDVHGSGHRISKSKAEILNNYGTNVTITQSSFQAEEWF